MDSPKPPNKITEIVRLRQLLKKWRKRAIASKNDDNSNNNKNNNSNNNSNRNNSSSSNNNNNNSNRNNNNNNTKTVKFLKRTLSLSDRPVGGSAVRRGFLAVCVGDEQKRFTIPTEHLGHVAFHALLREAEEEFGFQQSGILRIPCHVAEFEAILRVVEGREDCRYGGDEGTGLYPPDSPLSQSHHPQSPMCR